MTDLKYSFIISCYNVQNYIGKCLRSLSDCKYQSVEFIIINDAATDHTQSEIERAIIGDPRFRCMVKKVNEGLLLSRKSGVEIALGEYVSFIDGDDFVKGNALENVLHALDDQPVSDIYHSSFITIKEGREALSRVFDQGHTNGSYLLDKLITSGFGGVFGFFFKRGELNSLTWWNDSSKEGRVSIGEDKFLLLQLLNKRNSIICLDPDLSYYCYIKHAASMTSKHRSSFSVQAEINLIKSLEMLIAKDRPNKSLTRYYMLSKICDCLFITNGLDPVLWEFYNRNIGKLRYRSAFVFIQYLYIQSYRFKWMPMARGVRAVRRRIA